MATNTQKEFRKQMKELEKQGKVSKGGSRRTVRFVEHKTLGFGAITFIGILAFNVLSGIIGSIGAQPMPEYMDESTNVVEEINQRETQLIQRMTEQIKSGQAFSNEELVNIKAEINTLRDALPEISYIEGAVSIENRQLDQIDTILLNVSEIPLSAKQIDAVNNAITIYNGLDVHSENPVELVK